MNEKRVRPLRVLNRDGSMNISKRHQGLNLSDLYFRLLNLKWGELLLVIFLTYLLLNLIFASLYYSLGQTALDNIQTNSSLSHFQDCFFFSVQTFATIGYGKITPQGFLANSIVTIEALFGLFSVALFTGLVFARFSRPVGKVIFADKAILGTHNGKPCFYFRLANGRTNQIVEAQIRVTMVRDEQNLEGQKFRGFTDLALERSSSPMFSLSWTVRHIVNEQSPLYKLSCEDLQKVNAEFLVSLTGIDATYSQTIHARHSYIAEEIVSNRHYKDILIRKDDGKLELDLENISEFNFE